MILSSVEIQDLAPIRDLIASAIRANVARSEEEAAFLIDDIDESLEWWRENPDSSLHLKYGDAGLVSGVVLVKEFWNLTNLFVAPDFQRQGIGRLLLTEALESCRSRSPRAAVLVNSSTHAVGFYERMHFVQTGPGKDRPGGCVPFRYDF
ncbi:MAG: GNAT family N-acetyltransferase [Gammaproteobacteria bacterium]